MAKRHAPETRAAVLAALLEGQSVSKVASQYKLPQSTVATWKKRYKDDGGDLYHPKDISDLLLTYLKTNLETLQKQAVFFSDQTWLKDQSASELGVLHGILADKTIRILEAYGAQEDGGS